MAIAPKDRYPAQTLDSDPNYPHGKARNVTVPGDGTGTPFEKDWLNDLWGFLQALLAAAGITPSGTPDHASSSQYLSALNFLYPAESRMDTAESNITSLDTRVDTLEADTVDGAASSVDNEVPRFDGVTGKIIQGSDLTIDDAGNLIYKAAKSRSTRIPACAFTPNFAIAGGTIGVAGMQHITSDLSWLRLDLGRYLPSGALLKTVRVIVDPGEARATTTNRMLLRVEKVTGQVFTGSPSAGSVTYYPSSSGDVDDGTADPQVLEVASINQTIDAATAVFYVSVRGGSTAGTPGIGDGVFACEVDWDDPGPRNN